MKMINIVFIGMFLSISLPASAGVYSDNLSRCLVESSSSEDKLTLVKWMFTAMAFHPAVKSIAPITDTQRDDANKNVAELFTRLTTETCLEQARKAVKYEGAVALESSFNIFGQVAAQELFANPDVAAGMAGLEKYMDADKINKTLSISE